VHIRRIVCASSFVAIGVVSCSSGSDGSVSVAASGGSPSGAGGHVATGGAPFGGIGGADSGGASPRSGTGGGAGAGGTSGSGGASSDAGDAGGNIFVDIVTASPANDRCLQSSLTAGCRIFLDGVAAGCDQPGLSPVTSERDVTAVSNRLRSAGFQPLPAGALCLLGQLPAPSSAGGACLDNTVPGWCYVHGSCLPMKTTQPCAQAICETPPLSNITYAVALLACP
jgi:hypothetical protein